MCSKVSAVPSYSEVARRSAQFQASVWGDYFLSYHSLPREEGNQLMEKQMEELKEEIKCQLIFATKDKTEKLRLIDSIQRLGVSYHFENEIHKILQQLHHIAITANNDDDDLHTITLSFRLLRQQGYNISSQLFDKFRGKWESSYDNNVEELLSLYEASQLRMRGEEALDEAFRFANARLEAIVSDSATEPMVAAEVRRALKWPLYKNLPRLEARHYIGLYSEKPWKNEGLLNFAKMDFNQLQKLHQKEIAYISEWWEDYGFAEKLSFARNRIVEGYFFALGIFFEPQFLSARLIMTKIIAIGSMLDDIYDVYGTFEELELLTHALERWEKSETEQLPNYLKMYYDALLDVFDKIEHEMSNQETTTYCIHHMKEATKELGRVFLVEANWCKEGYTPTVEEYLDIALISFGHKLLMVTALLGMGDLGTQQAVQWVTSMPNILKASTVICRFMNDMVSHKFEQERGHVASAIECYMEQNSASEYDAINALHKQIDDSWKDIVENYCVVTTNDEVPRAVLRRVLNLTRLFNVIYKDGDGYTQSQGSTKAYIKSLLVDSVPL
ncbi:alpha-farnesene synthase-like [Benincasa hispida]|uniref:alpha-farnesene synthase-like n=1 Tax=Benincasa hispida TaxID=102211 RepID=UPI001900BC69|nr:alpha-farnesene synthase-like [Benincasa hispida]XP_038903297.1 alpha-farnesene synthase-like [Benincasa hispida]